MLNPDMRIFVALDLDQSIRQRIETFVQQIRSNAPDVRWIGSDSLHVTLKFIGEVTEDTIPRIEGALAAIHSESFQLRFAGTGFFPAPRSARVFWIGIAASDALSNLAGRIDDALAEVGIEKEGRAFSPHLTLARARGGSGAPGPRKGDKPNRQFAKLQDFLTAHPAQDFGTMTAREFFLYRSQLSSKGSQYTKLAHFDLEPTTA
ncbi:MAG: RNA 2',3'-cyclic phosphodiesterase [Acidobacteria bacterium]|jgi:2'-5' RNA ligase|nr:MAG: RNA 2',3'-cyclic phosphodiesterase [Acidobacteriota bacterium]